MFIYPRIFLKFPLPYQSMDDHRKDNIQRTEALFEVALFVPSSSSTSASMSSLCDTSASSGLAA
jgi:hypothetical protein